MISVIICSKNNNEFESISANIFKTIGCEYELLFYDNSNESRSLPYVYNLLVKKAKYSCIIFLHEDVEFLSLNWGNTVYQILKSSNIGLLGLSGSVYKSNYQGVWSASNSSTYRISGQKSTLEFSNEKNYVNVAVIDGCFMATKKELILSYPFDNNLTGFHCYDIDLSINIGQFYDVAVTKSICFRHHSDGIQNKDWLISSLYIHNKWANKLPKKVGMLVRLDEQTSDYISAQNIYKIMYEQQFSTFRILHYYCLFITKFFLFNKFKYTKKTIYFILRKIKDKLEIIFSQAVIIW